MIQYLNCVPNVEKIPRMAFDMFFFSAIQRIIVSSVAKKGHIVYFKIEQDVSVTHLWPSNHPW